MKRESVWQQNLTFSPKFVKNSRIFDQNSTNFSKKSKTQAKFPENSTKLSQKLKVPEVFKTGYPAKIAQKKSLNYFVERHDSISKSPFVYKAQCARVTP